MWRIKIVANLMTFATVLALSALILGGCATIVHGTTENVRLSTTPQGADATVDGGERVVTPAEVELSRGDSHTVVFQKAGYRDDTVNLTSTVSYGALGYSLFALGGPISAAVDWGDGAARELSNDSLHVTLVALPAATAGAASATASATLAASAQPPSAQAVATTPVFAKNDPTSESAGVAQRFAYVSLQVIAGLFLAACF